MARVEFGETWVYESIVSALPGIDVSRRLAIAIQLGIFEVGVLLSAWYYDLWGAALAGTAAVFVAALGSVEMLRISSLVRSESLPHTYRQLLFGSSIEVVLGVLAYVALITQIFVFAPQRGGDSLLDTLIGPEPPVVVVYLILLVLWDVCYRIGTAWWASVVALWRSVRYRFDPRTARALRRSDLEIVAFATAQLVLYPFVADQPVIQTVILGHVAAVWGVSGLSAVLVTVRARDEAENRRESAAR
ncbi:DUF7530 family protein [Halomarina ordinaria]|uniref:Uncharacterized protein n=1 Tax=Halomarina ordinaria TaxID=3033939 RepID=A0ABD5UCX5_9EURY|nr:hypothetical protein [Halomarina sp. PSRA2]